MQPNNRNQVITSRVTLEQKNVYINNAEKSNLSLSEWIAETLNKGGATSEVAIDLLKDDLEVKNKLINRLTNQLENADNYITILEKRNLNYKVRIARLTSTIDKLNQASTEEVKVTSASSLNSKNNPLYILGSITVLLGAIIFANR